MTKFKRQWTKTYKGSKGIKNNLPSKTVPDMTLSVLELLQNHSRGIHSEINDNQGEYFETEIPNIIDPLTEIPILRSELEAKEKALQERITAEQKANEAKLPEADEKPAKIPQNAPKEQKQTKESE